MKHHSSKNFSRSLILSLILSLSLIASLAGCATSGRLPLDFSNATPERVEQITGLVAGRLDQMGKPVERADIAIVACGSIGAAAYFSLPDPATKEERLGAAIDAANGHGRQYYRDVLGDQTFVEFAVGRLDLGEFASDAEEAIGLMRYFLLKPL